MTEAVDYSTARPDPAGLAQRFGGVLRYLAPLPNQKVTDRAEIDALHAAGLSVGFVWETVSSRAGQGYSAGVTDAQQANGLADNLGIPDTVTIYYAVDYDAAPDTIVGYFQGVNSVARRPVGGYGSFQVIERLLDDGLIVHAWQTVAWSRGQKSARAHIFQRADAGANPPPGTDVNDILQDDWGQWTPQGADDLTPDEHANLYDMRRDLTAFFGEFRVYAATHNNAGIDPAAVAKAIVDAGVGKQVADELAKRLAG